MYSVGIMLLCFFSVMFIEIFCIQLQQTPRKCCRKSGETLISLKEFLKYSYTVCFLSSHALCVAKLPIVTIGLFLQELVH